MGSLTSYCRVIETNMILAVLIQSLSESRGQVRRSVENGQGDVTRCGASLSRSSSIDWGGELRHGDPLRSVLCLSLFRWRVTTDGLVQ